MTSFGNPCCLSMNTWPSHVNEVFFFLFCVTMKYFKGHLLMAPHPDTLLLVLGFYVLGF